MFFKKQKTIEFWSLIPGVEKTSPILEAKDILPDWWKNISSKNVSPDTNSLFTKIFTEKRTVKKCPSIRNILTNGWVLTMFCDLLIKISENNIAFQYSFPGCENLGAIHPDWQMIDFLPPEAKDKYVCVFKPYCPYLIKTPPGYSTLHLDPFYFFNPSFDSATGIQDSDIYHDMSPQLLLKQKEVFIPKGTPLQIIIPFKREKIEGQIIPFCEETQKLTTYTKLVTYSKFSSAASYNEHVKKTKACPFSK